MSTNSSGPERPLAERPIPERVEIYDTTLRDGSQLEGISLTVDDKLRIAEQLDWLGVDYIEAGWPGANPKDDELFRRAPDELELTTSKLVAFGMTRRVKGKVDSDDTLRHLVEANTATVCIVGKCWDYHVLDALGTTLDEVSVQRDPSCPVCGESPTITEYVDYVEFCAGVSP
jgi:2-isopropylmalate synthase